MKQEYLDLVIVKSNKLIESKNHFSVIQQRIMSIAFGMLRPDQEKFEWIHIPYLDLFDTKTKKGGSQYQIVKDALREMSALSIFIQQDNGLWESVPFLQAAGDDVAKTVKVRFVENARDLLLNLTGNFTKYLVKSISKFESSYSFKVYELCKQYVRLKEREETLLFLRERLGVLRGYEDTAAGRRRLQQDHEENKLNTLYPEFRDFNAKILKVAQREINKHSDIYIEYEKIRQGRSVTSIKFKIRLNQANIEEEDVVNVSVQKGQSIQAAAPTPPTKTIDIPHQEILSKEEYANQYVEQQKSVKNPSAYKSKLMKDPNFDEQYQKVAKQTQSKKKAEIAKSEKQQEEQLVEKLKAEYGEEFKNIRVPYCEMANENVSLLDDFLEWLNANYSGVDRRRLLERVGERELQKSDWIKFGTFMINRQGTEYEKRFFMNADPKLYIQMRLAELHSTPKAKPAKKSVFSGF
ncbi:replication initiation protein [Persicobacter psychrovividus]|uniref:Initiator Rep protein WH1 domain-containing protein n=1 Tax=Persicobacter psychrovividus TaxID=387638 RepID=A0ABM7VN57_9BACT|nr:hypothetical protein PEPS_46700 [Persicobacter psychrovividus]